MVDCLPRKYLKP